MGRKNVAVPAPAVAPQAKVAEPPVQAVPRSEKTMSTTQLERLRTMTSIVADTGDFDAIRAFAPEDCTTNPSLLLAAAKMPKFLGDLEQAAKEAKAETGTDNLEALVSDICDRFAVKVGLRLLELLPKEGRVSTEVDAELSFDTEATIAKAHQLVKLYAAHGVGKDRILIKLASTWESIQACKALEEQGIKCNMTLLFSFAQAVACAEAGATLISPFVGRILDWYKKNTDLHATALVFVSLDSGVGKMKPAFFVQGLFHSHQWAWIQRTLHFSLLFVFWMTDARCWEHH